MLQEDRRLDVFAPITSRARGDVDLTYQADGRSETIDDEVTSGAAALDRIRFKESITAGQARLRRDLQKTPPSPPPSSTASYTAPPSCRSTATVPHARTPRLPIDLRASLSYPAERGIPTITTGEPSCSSGSGRQSLSAQVPPAAPKRSVRDRRGLGQRDRSLEQSRTLLCSSWKPGRGHAGARAVGAGRRPGDDVAVATPCPRGRSATDSASVRRHTVASTP